jgi:recombination associated protein RdgC
MLFKNARFFRFSKPFETTAEALENHLKEDAFKPCGPQESSRQGWVRPLGRHGEQLVHTADGCFLVCLNKQEKILPPAAINEMVDERVEAIEAEQLRKVRRREKQEIKDEITLECLPKAFSRSKKTYAFINPRDGYLVVDAGSAKVAEDLASSLRKSLGSLPVRPPATNESPSFHLTGWLNETIDRPEKITLGTDCQLQDPSEDGGKIVATGLDLESDEVRNHIEAGMQVIRLTVEWDENLTFKLNSDLGISGIRFGDTLRSELDDIDATDAAAHFDASFCLMVREFSRLFAGILEAFGGEDRSAIVEDADQAMTVPHAPEPKSETPPSPAMDERDPDALFDVAKDLVTSDQRASISGIQRRLKIGYNRAAHLMEELEARGVVSQAGHDGAREVLVAPAQ